MKLRIKDNSLRLRLSRSEVDLLKSKLSIQSTMLLSFPTSKELKYELIKSTKDVFEVGFSEWSLIISVPESEILSWVNTDQVGIYKVIEINKDKTLHVIIEKDFQCLVAREHEDDSDSFPNPNS